MAQADRALRHRVELPATTRYRLVGVGLTGLMDDRQELLFPELSNPAHGPDVVITLHTDESELGPLNARSAGAEMWHNTQDIVHSEYGHGWVQGTGSGVVSVRFETRATGPGRTKSFAASDRDLVPADPLDSLDWQDWLETQD